tara:strand:- start:288 stop:428 length:141 start_codon:yes stop_codon:yes gene_type:complete
MEKREQEQASSASSTCTLVRDEKADSIEFNHCDIATPDGSKLLLKV